MGDSCCLCWLSCSQTSSSPSSVFSSTSISCPASIGYSCCAVLSTPERASSNDGSSLCATTTCNSSRPAGWERRRCSSSWINCTTLSWKRSSRRGCELGRLRQRPPKAIWSWMREASIQGRSHSRTTCCVGVEASCDGLRDGACSRLAIASSFQPGVRSTVRVGSKLSGRGLVLNPRRRTATRPASSHTSISTSGASPLATLALLCR